MGWTGKTQGHRSGDRPRAKDASTGAAGTGDANGDDAPCRQEAAGPASADRPENRLASGQQANGHIRVRGARVHNLQQLQVDIPRNRLVVMTGPSGSGKSSLAFNTLFAEGQRQYIESLSVYARQFFHQLQRPDVDLIEGLPPTICIDQEPSTHGRRSTVATVTEIYDYLRLLMARCGTPHCYRCGAPIEQQDPQQIRDRLMALPEGTKLMVMAPLVRGRKGKHRDILARIRKIGFVRARIDGNVYDMESLPELDPRRVHHIDAVVDRIIVREGLEQRMGDSVRLALQHGEGLLVACYLRPDETDLQPPRFGWHDQWFSSRYACAQCNVSYEEIEPRTFSFNSAYGACPVCEGLGAVEQFDPELAVPDRQWSVAQGAIAPWRTLTPGRRSRLEASLDRFWKNHKVDPNLSLASLDDAAWEAFLFGDDGGFVGLLTLLEREYATTTSVKRKRQLEPFRGLVRCHACQGSRLRPEATHVRLEGRSINQLTALSLSAALEFFRGWAIPPEWEDVAFPLVQEICKRLDFLCQVGVDYLTLDRAAGTLSGGELQRVRLASGIGSGLVGVCYILDEPSIGLHPRDNQRLIHALRALQALGNTVLVVEHDEELIRAADHLIDLGPGAGVAGGRIVAQGTPEEVARCDDSPTGRFLSGRATIGLPPHRRKVVKSRSIVLDGVTTNNLQNITARFPLSALVCVTGVSGSGKSSLIGETLVPALIRRLGGSAPKPGPHRGLRGATAIDRVILVDQSPIGRTPRSNPATFSGIFDEIRKVFAGTREARQRGFTAGRFSFNVKGGRCEACQGYGLQRIEMSFLPDLFVTCETCGGDRFNRQTLDVRYRGRNIADVLRMSVDEAAEFFQNFAHLVRMLSTFQRVGLGYLHLGQPSNTLSGGEAQRVKLATELARPDTGHSLYLLDEPTTGLHAEDIRRLLDVLQSLVDKDNSMIVVEHNLEVIKCADWVLDLGPEGGDRGGQIVAEGTPEEVSRHSESLTGTCLRRVLENGARG